MTYLEMAKQLLKDKVSGGSPNEPADACHLCGAELYIFDDHNQPLCQEHGEPVLQAQHRRIWQAMCRELGETQGWPGLQVAVHVAVLLGRDAWTGFLTRGRPEQLQLAARKLQAMQKGPS